MSNDAQKLIDAMLNDPDAREHAMTQLTIALEAIKTLKAMSDQALVNLALHHLQLDVYSNLIVEELCTRVYPDWTKGE